MITLLINAKFMIMAADYLNLSLKQIRPSHINTTTDQIVVVIKKYNTNKADGYDKVSVAMLQLCAAQVAIPLGIIFRKCVITGIFPDSWKYANVQPVHKKNHRQLISNYRPISILPICGKILEELFLTRSTRS